MVDLDRPIPNDGYSRRSDRLLPLCGTPRGPLIHGGRRIGLDECKELLAAQNLTLLPQHLVPTTPRQMLIRILTNIYHIVEQIDPAQSAEVGDWIDALRKRAGAEI